VEIIYENGEIMSTVIENEDYIKTISMFFANLSEDEQAIFYTDIRKLFKKKFESDYDDLPDDITMAEIVYECRQARKEIAEQKVIRTEKKQRSVYA